VGLQACGVLLLRPILRASRTLRFYICLSVEQIAKNTKAEHKIIPQARLVVETAQIRRAVPEASLGAALTDTRQQRERATTKQHCKRRRVIDLSFGHAPRERATTCKDSKNTSLHSAAIKIFSTSYFIMANQPSNPATSNLNINLPPPSISPQSSAPFTPRSASFADDSDAEFDPTPLQSPRADLIMMISHLRMMKHDIKP
jgi:hypothetical protein